MAATWSVGGDSRHGTNNMRAVCSIRRVPDVPAGSVLVRLVEEIYLEKVPWELFPIVDACLEKNIQ